MGLNHHLSFSVEGSYRVALLATIELPLSRVPHFYIKSLCNRGRLWVPECANFVLRPLVTHITARAPGGI